jgi:hypothetical protein
MTTTTSINEQQRSSALTNVAPLAHSIGARPTGHRRALASRLASAPLDPMRSTNRSTSRRSPDPHSCQANGSDQAAVGSTADSRRIANARNRGVGTDGISFTRPRPTATLANVENVPHQSPDLGGVDGFLLRPDADRPNPVRPRHPVTSPAQYRAPQRDRPSDCQLGRSTANRRVSG